jgi:glycosyltransferase involved in cell wall biosynthesis
VNVVPRLSVGLPVYNGQNYLAEALGSLLAQTYQDFELIISDNASTDDTEAICRRYAAADARIRYIRQPRNIGAAPNHDVLVREARGEFFKWASHDDLYGPELLARCVEYLDAHPEVVLCHADMVYIDQAGKVMHGYEYRIATDSLDPAERFRSLLLTDGGDDEYGVIRMSVLGRVNPAASYHNPGRTLVAEVALHGPFHQVPERLHFRRDHPGRGDRNPTIKSVCANLDPRRKNHSTARLLAEYLWGYVDAIRRSPISPADRRRCYRELVAWLAGRSTARTSGRMERTVPTGTENARQESAR